MGFVSGLRRKNTAAYSAKDGSSGLPAFLPEVQAGKYHQHIRFSNENCKSARRKDAALTISSWSNAASFSGDQL